MLTSSFYLTFVKFLLRKQKFLHHFVFDSLLYSRSEQLFVSFVVLFNYSNDSFVIFYYLIFRNRFGFALLHRLVYRCNDRVDERRQVHEFTLRCNRPTSFPVLFPTFKGKALGTRLANADVADRLFQRHGRWKSVAAKDGYVDDSLDSRLSVSKNLGI